MSFTLPMSLIKRLLFRVASVCISVGNKINPSEKELALRAWYAAEGDYKLRLDYDLDETSIVFDMGGYQGQWASDIFSKYRSQIHIFEPVNQFADLIEQRFSRNPQISLHRCGLSSKNQKVKIGLQNDGSSLFLSSDTTIEAELFEAVEFLNSININHIDLMKINIEGGEYDLLECLIDSGYIKKIRNIQVQFHDNVPEAENRMGRIHECLRKTHRLTYFYKFVWENWMLKSEEY